MFKVRWVKSQHKAKGREWVHTCRVEPGTATKKKQKKKQKKHLLQLDLTVPTCNVIPVLRKLHHNFLSEGYKRDHLKK